MKIHMVFHFFDSFNNIVFHNWIIIIIGYLLIKKLFPLGKWQYEFMLGTKGVMQVGWATRNCQFSEEKGVGKYSYHRAYSYTMYM